MKFWVLAALMALVAYQTFEVARPHLPAIALARNSRSAIKFDRPSYADAIERTASSVVTIRALRRIAATDNLLLPDFSTSDLFRLPPQDSAPDAGIRVALGSGVIVEQGGVILTNHHVTDGAETIAVELADHRAFEAKLIGSDPPSDLAVIQIEPRNLAALPLADSDRVRVGDVVLAIGNPLGIGQTVTAGIISAKGRAMTAGRGSFEDFLQTDAPINQGNSGGALITAEGELIGITSQILSMSGGNIGIGFAIPSNMARGVLDQLVTTGKVRRSQLGVATRPITPEAAARLGLNAARGLVINTVIPGSPAAHAGLQAGDVIVAFNGAPVLDGNSLRNHVANTAPGTTVGFTVWRRERELNFQVVLKELKNRNRG
jgi:Do/DeqQ family serine protease